MMKKLFALMLCLALVFTFAPTLAFAEDTVIDTVAITIADPVAGEYPTYMSDMLEGMNYTVYGENWINNTDGFVDLKSKETFELGKEYIYSVWFKPNEGYSFAYNAVATISNPAWTIVDMVVIDGALHFQANYTVTTGENRVIPDEEKIKETLNLNLGTYNCLPGQNPTYINGAIDSERYYVYHEMWYNLTDMEQLNEDETFELGKLYDYELVIKPYEEYAFTDDSKVTVDGVEWNINSMMVAYGGGYDGEFIFSGRYTAAYETIDNVSLNIEEVEAGKPLVFIDGVPEDANYTIYSQIWSKDAGEPIPQDSTYDVNGIYEYMIFLVPNEGYRFTLNTTGTVNGIEWDYEAFFPSDDEWFGDFKYGVFFGECKAYEKETQSPTEAPTEITTEAPTEITTEATAEVTTEVATEEITTEATTAEATSEVTTAEPIDTPETGNTTDAVLWVLLLCTAAGAFVTVLAVRARKQ